MFGVHKNFDLTTGVINDSPNLTGASPMKKPILYIDEHYVYSTSKGHVVAYYSISDSKTNKTWIVEYNTTLSEIIHYAMGYSEALNYDPHLYFSPRVDLSSYPEFLINVLTENEFQQKRDA